MRFLLAVVLLAGCTNREHAVKILERDGYTDVEMTGYKVFSCSDDDFYHTGFKAKKNNQIIEGTVCGGFFLKGATIRFD